MGTARKYSLSYQLRYDHKVLEGRRRFIRVNKCGFYKSYVQLTQVQKKIHCFIFNCNDFMKLSITEIRTRNKNVMKFNVCLNGLRPLFYFLQVILLITVIIFIVESAFNVTTCYYTTTTMLATQSVKKLHWGHKIVPI